MPCSPSPAVATPAAVWPSSVTSMSSVASVARTCIDACDAFAWRSTFVSASWTIRYAAASMADGTTVPFTCTSRSARSPAVRACSTSAGSAARSKAGAVGAASPSSRRRLRVARRSRSAVLETSLMSWSAAPGSSDSRRSSATLERTLIATREWASVSWRSRAIRNRSAATRRSASRSRSRCSRSARSRPAARKARRERIVSPSTSDANTSRTRNTEPVSSTLPSISTTATTATTAVIAPTITERLRLPCRATV
jgi:hypothetical protein